MQPSPGAVATTPPEPVSETAPPLRGPVLMSQDWRDLTYVHWAVPCDDVAHLMPPGVRPDPVGPGGHTYLGLVPFRMVGAGPGRHTRVPWLGTFLETNLRLYSVDAGGRRGVVFVSLDADRLAVVAGARAAFGTPYRWARMTHQVRHGPAGEEHRYEHRLRGRGRAGLTLHVRVGARREPTELDLALSARWRLHTSVLGRTLLVPNEHPPWPLHDAEVLDLHDDGLLASVGLGHVHGRTPDHVAFSPGVHTRFGWPRSASA